MRLLVSLFVLSFFTSMEVWAEPNSKSLDAHRQSTRSLGVAGAYAGFANDQSLFYQNTAGLARFLGRRRVAIDSRFFKRESGESFPYGIQAALIDGITENPLAWGFLYNFTKTTDERMHDIILGSAFGIDDWLFFGFQSQLTNYNTARLTRDEWVYSIDLSTMVLLGNYYGIAGGVRNLVRTKSDGRATPLEVFLAPSLNLLSLRLNIEGTRDFSNSEWLFRTGAEYQVQEWMTVRSGFSVADDDKGYGFGFTLSPLKGFAFSGGFYDRLSSEYWNASAGIDVTFR